MRSRETLADFGETVLGSRETRADFAEKRLRFGESGADRGHPSAVSAILFADVDYDGVVAD